MNKRIYDLGIKAPADIDTSWELEIDKLGQVESSKATIATILSFVTNDAGGHTTIGTGGDYLTIADAIADGEYFLWQVGAIAEKANTTITENFSLIGNVKDTIALGSSKLTFESSAYIRNCNFTNNFQNNSLDSLATTNCSIRFYNTNSLLQSSVTLLNNEFKSGSTGTNTAFIGWIGANLNSSINIVGNAFNAGTALNYGVYLYTNLIATKSINIHNNDSIITNALNPSFFVASYAGQGGMTPDIQGNTQTGAFAGVANSGIFTLTNTIFTGNKIYTAGPIDFQTSTTAAHPRLCKVANNYFAGDISLVDEKVDFYHNVVDGNLTISASTCDASHNTLATGTITVDAALVNTLLVANKTDTVIVDNSGVATQSVNIII